MKNKKIFSYFLAFIIPMLIMVLLYMIVGIYPFGSKTVLTVDLQNQYVEFFSAFKDIVQNGGNIFYSFSKTLGGNMYGLICYYLLSPFNIILLLFSKANIIDAVFLINVLKIGFCGLTSFIYFDKTFKYKTSVSFMFSICYSLMAYNIVYSQNIMWLDGVIWLPIVFLGIDKLLNKKPILFFISLTISIFSNYYIGYMTCIASLIYFIYKLYLKNNYKFSIKKDIKEILYFFKYTLLSVGVTAIIIIPSIFSLLAGKVSSSLSEFIPKQTYAFFDLLSKFYLGSFKNSDLSGGTPIVYVSVIMIFLLFLYFVNKKIDYKEKKASAILLSVFFISFTFYSVDLIWHTFQHPAGFSYRYSFIFDFVLLIIAYKSYININKIDKDKLFKFLITSFIITIAVDKFVYTQQSFYKIIGTFVLLLIYSLYFYYRKNKNLNIFIIILVVIEMFINSLLVVVNIKYFSRNEYVDFVNNYSEIINSIKKDDSSFYRLESETNYSTNDPMLLNYNGISHFSSTYESKNNKLLGDYLGIFNRFYITNYLGSTPVTNSLFNIKYVLSKRKLPYYQLLKTENNINLYKNNNYLPFMFMVDGNVLDMKLNKLEPFNNQNLILNTMTNTNKNVFENNNFNITLNNVKQNEKVTKYKEYKKVNLNRDASITFDINVEYDGLLYAYISSDYNKKVDILLNGESIIDTEEENSYRYNILELGNYKKGDKVSLEIILLEDDLKITDYVFSTFNETEFKEKINLLNSNDSFKMEEFKTNYIKGKINVSDSNQILYTSIPVDNGWNIYIDGRKVEYDVIMDTFIGLTLDSGEHTIEFEYIPRGFTSGMCVSMLSIALLGYAIYSERKKRVNKN